MGEALENYLKDVFAGTLNETNEQDRLVKLGQVFAYQGNQNNPPDIIVRGGDAIEVKKIESPNSKLALNSSYPKAKVFSNSPMITDACRNCEDWEEKDILYAVGVVNRNHLLKLFFVYGVDYAASAEIYERIKNIISSGVNSITTVELARTDEIGRVNRVDPLGITYLRVRGMWGMENPSKVFSYVLPRIPRSDFQFTAIINSDKYNSFPAEDRYTLESISDAQYQVSQLQRKSSIERNSYSEKELKELELLTMPNFSITDVKIKTPDNPSILKDAKLINFIRRTEG
jgi:hypothetical protein